MSIFQPKKKTVEPDAVPTNVEQAIPIQGVFEDGIFLVGRNLWSKTFTFTDINYAVASREDKEGLLPYDEGNSRYQCHDEAYYIRDCRHDLESFRSDADVCRDDACHK